MSRRPYPRDISEKSREALDIFSDEELESLRAFYDVDTGGFEFLGFVGLGGKVTQFADPIKAEALAIIEEAYREELKTRNKEYYRFDGEKWRI